VNSEELERSLRTEFETYLKGIVAGMRQDVADFQKNFEAEFEKHKSQLDEAFRDLSTRFESDTQFDEVFISSVVEHLRLSRDEGAELAATAFGEAEKLAEETAQPLAKFDELRDAINEISGKTSQAEILSSLIDHAANFTPRGAFFIVKNDHFVGWKVFGKEGNADDAAVREIQLRIDADTVLAGAVNTLKTQESAYGTQADDNLFLEPLDYSKPDRMYAIPLTARGRGVAVLYADYGAEGVSLNVEALETLVRVAGLTVELLAASQPSPTQAPYPPPEADAQDPDQYEAAPVEEETVSGDSNAESENEEAAELQAEPEENYSVEPTVSESEAEPVEENAELEAVEEYQGEVSYEMPADSDTPETAEESSEEIEFVTSDQSNESASIETESYLEPVEESVVEETAPAEEVSYFEPEAESDAVGPEFDVTTKEAAFVQHDSYDAGATDNAEPAGFAAPVPETNGWANGGVATTVAEPVVEVAAAQATRTRFSERNVDLPIEVPEEERRVHNDARRFARLLVSEIKLYNEQQVTEGRETGNLYDRLRDAIDRSREMYAKRVQPAVASKFDYFHYELVNSLAEGNDAKLGNNYPGALV